MRLLSLAFLLVTVGCNGDPVPTATSTPKTEPVKTEPVKTEPVKTEPVTTGTNSTGQKQPSPPEPQPDLPSAQRIYPLKDLETTKLEFNGRKITAWVMNNASKRAEGMMFLSDKEVKPDESMLFVFPDEQGRSFWMRNTLIPLDIAYLDQRGRAVSVHLMKALDESGTPSKGAAMYALEMKAGAFKRLGIKAGTTFKIPKEVVAED
jgi:uncharacterized protein